MARPATGTVVEPKGARKSWAIRFRANGKRQSVTLGRPPEWNRRRAEEALADELARVRAGVWEPPKPAPVTSPHGDVEIEDFHAFAEQWFEGKMPEIRPQTIDDYRGMLELHLLPFFGRHLLAELTIAEVDRYKTSKLREGKLAAPQINKSLRLLSQILDVAVDYGLMPFNPAASKGGRRRVKELPPKRTWVEPEQLLTLFESAPKGHRVILATLAGAGLRVGEACALQWRDLDLATATLTVQESKTPSGRREVDLPDALVTELWTLAATSSMTAPDDPVFVGRRGTAQTPANVSRRLKTAITAANKQLEAAGISPMSERVTPHSLRRTFASLRYVLGDDPITVAEQGGWASPEFPMRIYAKAVKRRSKLDGGALEQFDAALEWAQIGTKSDSGADADASKLDTGRSKRQARAAN